MKPMSMSGYSAHRVGTDLRHAGELADPADVPPDPVPPVMAAADVLEQRRLRLATLDQGAQVRTQHLGDFDRADTRAGLGRRHPEERRILVHVADDAIRDLSCS
jgi:hypothetical protein